MEWDKRNKKGGYWTRDNKDFPIKDSLASPVIFGFDVICLYPNLNPIGVAQITADAIRKTTVKLEVFDYAFLIIHLLLVLGRSKLMKWGLS